MDMMIIFMVFCSAVPLTLYLRHRGMWALLQFPFLTGMWFYFWFAFFKVDVHPFVHDLLLFAFFANLVFTEFSLIRIVTDLGHDIRNGKFSYRPGRKPTTD